MTKQTHPAEHTEGTEGTGNSTGPHIHAEGTAQGTEGTAQGTAQGDAGTPAPEAAGAAQGTVPDPAADETPGQDPADKPGREAAKYRRQLREVEAERDELRATLDHVQHAEVERATGDRLVSHELLWIDGHKASEFYSKNGQIDPAKLDARVQQVRDKFGDGVFTKPQRGPFVPNEGRQPRNPGAGSGSKFADAFKPSSGH